MATEDFIPVTIDDWYQRRRQDDTGKFFDLVADQSRQKGEGGATRQGIYTLTADGQLLEYGNAGNSAKVTLKQLQQALRKFQSLPRNRTAPGMVRVPEHGPNDEQYTREPPKGGLIVQVHGRILDSEQGSLTKGECSFVGGDKASRDFLWIKKEEIAQLVPSSDTVGTTMPMPETIARRILRYHLTDNTRGEPSMWKAEEIRNSSLKLTITASDAESMTLLLEGTATLATDADLAQADRGFVVKLRGELRYDRDAETFTQFDIAALGEHWGRGSYTPNPRPGKSLLGIAFGLAEEIPANRIPPQAARRLEDYYKP